MREQLKIYTVTVYDINLKTAICKNFQISPVVEILNILELSYDCSFINYMTGKAMAAHK